MSLSAPLQDRADQFCADQICPICDSNLFDLSVKPYIRCRSCNLELAIEPPPNPVLTNSNSNQIKSIKIGWLTKSQAKAQVSHLKLDATTLDFGAGRGDLVYYLKKLGFSAYGIERDQPSIQFADKTLGITLFQSLHELEYKFNSVSMWHALEHLTIEEALHVLGLIKEKLLGSGEIILSVPNSDSWFYRLFGMNYCFFDRSAHPVNYSPAAIKKLAGKIGLKQGDYFFILPYALVGYVLSLTNLLFPIRNYIHERFKRGSIQGSHILDLAALSLALITVPLAIICSLLDLLIPSRGLVINCKLLK